MAKLSFRPRAPWLGGHLQTLRNQLVRANPDLSSWPTEGLVIRLPDGDRLPVTLNIGRGAARPLVLLIHGLTGCEESVYLRATAAWFLGRGWPVLRVNLRGAGLAGPLCRGSYHAGRTEDLRALLAVLRWRRPELIARGVLPIGFSLGGNMLLKFLAEGDFPVEVPAAAAVSAPLDLEAAQACLMQPRNRVYHRHILRHLRHELRASAQEVDAERKRRAARARTLREFDDVWTAPINGFDGAADYYRRCAAGPLLPEIRVPTLAVHAADDPLVPAAAYEAARRAGNPALTLVLPDSGGHVGFHAADRPEPWHDRVIEAFLADRLGLENEIRRPAA